MQDKVTKKRVRHQPYRKEKYLKNKETHSKASKDYYLRHKEEARIWQRKYRETNKIMIHDKRLKRLYGIGYEQYSKMFESQNGNCAICLEQKELVVDHDHNTKEVRGLLCTSCNFGIGNLKDSLLLLESAKQYIINSNQNLCKK